MKMSYKSKSSSIKFPLGFISYQGRLHLGTIIVDESAKLSESQVLAILGEVVQQTNAKIKVEFEEGVTLEFE